MRSRSGMTIAVGPSHPDNIGTSGFYSSGRHRVHQARGTVRCSASRTKGESYKQSSLRWGEGGGGAFFVACLSHSSVDHAPPSRRNTVRGVLDIHSCMAVVCQTIDPRIPSLPGRSTPDFPQPDRHFLQGRWSVERRGNEACAGRA